MFCQECGQKLADGTKFCPYCGAKIQAAPPPVEETTGQEETVEKSRFCHHTGLRY